MADVLHRVTRTFLRSVNSPDFPARDWIIGPDLSAVAGVPPRYWKIDGDAVQPMTQAERDAVDAAVVTEIRQAEAAGYDEDKLLRAVALVLLDEVNALRTRASLAPRTTDQLRTAIRAKLDTL